MTFANPFTPEGIWLKGNTHAHTTQSDGKLTPLHRAEEYARRGYDFLFLTDHWKRTEIDCPEGILVIAAEEIDFRPVPEGPSHHVVCFGLEREWQKRKFRSLGELAKYAGKEGVDLIIAHPYWSGVRSQTYIGLTGFLGVEVHNSVCGGIGRSLSAVHWDDMLENGQRMHGFAADDTHRLTPDIVFKGWIMVKSQARTETDIFDAIRKGLFYSTQGPEIHSINVTPDRISVSCSPCRRINFISRKSQGLTLFAPENEWLTQGSYPIRPDGIYVRIECIDADGKTAWSNPIYQNQAAPDTP
ncbi:hypothetical protein HQ520_10055 [bacterium]|nr:hypothetical protein [bacterium]